MTISGKSLGLFELNKKLNVAKQNGFMFNQINKLTINFYSHLRYIIISFSLKSQRPMCKRQFFRVISKNREYVDSFSNDWNKPFQFACQKWINHFD